MNQRLHNYLLIYFTTLLAIIIGLWENDVGHMTGRIPKESDGSIHQTQPVAQNVSLKGEWIKVHIPVETALLAMDFNTMNDGWAVGLGGTILRWDGMEWTEQPSPVEYTLHAVEALSQDDAWAVGEGGIVHWDGLTWSEAVIPTSFPLYDVSFISPDWGWAVGGYEGDYTAEVLETSQVILHWDGIQWKEFPTAALGPDDGVAYPLVSIYMVSRDSGWITDNINTFHWDGTGFQWIEGPPDIVFNTVFAIDPNRVWAVGYGGYMVDDQNSSLRGGICFIDENGWKVVYRTPPETERQYRWDMNSLAMVDPDFGWAGGGRTVGYKSLLLMWDGQEWKDYPISAQYPIVFIWASGRDNGWLLTRGYDDQGHDQGEIYRYVVSSTTPQPSAKNITSTPFSKTPSFTRPTQSQIATNLPFPTPEPSSMVNRPIENRYFTPTWIIGGVLLVLLSAILIIFVNRNHQP